ncbi:hypothetical protein B0H34DRAFT_807283 [Crassisporium funariophilum]|nr:hypothetical protein B0H34DRAFT_807283 [Crassisporium funariophilum]
MLLHDNPSPQEDQIAPASPAQPIVPEEEDPGHLFGLTYTLPDFNPCKPPRLQPIRRQKLHRGVPITARLIQADDAVYFGCLADVSEFCTLMGQFRLIRVQTVWRLRNTPADLPVWLNNLGTSLVNQTEALHGVGVARTSPFLVWNQLNNLRTPLDDLPVHDAELANELLYVSKALESAGSKGGTVMYGASLSPTITLQDEMIAHVKLSKTWDELLGKLPHPDSDPSRIRWCATGPLAFLPMHAAGLYAPDAEGQRNILSDLAISSYTPTVTVLLERVKNPRKLDKQNNGVLIIN